MVEFEVLNSIKAKQELDPTKMMRESISGLHLKLSSNNFTLLLLLLLVLTPKAIAWTGEIRGRVVCDVCGDSSIGPEDHVLQGSAFFLIVSCCGSLFFFFFF